MGKRCHTRPLRGGSVRRKMRTLAICTVIFAIAPLYGQQERESVVLVHTETESGYGVAWNRPDGIVTALHLVAGKSKILVVGKNRRSSPATIESIHKEADLALLKLETPLGIPPLEIFQGDPPLNRPLNYWESPVRNFNMNSKETLLNAEKNAIPLRQFDKRITADPNKLDIFARALCADGGTVYPSLNTRVYKFMERNVGKSHSGSPITYKGRIVGMVDGGQPIAGKASVWAIPAAGNFENLLQSNAPPPGESCSTDKLYGGIREDNPLLKDNETLRNWAAAVASYEENPVQYLDATNDTMTFSLEYRAQYRDIVATMFEEDLAHMEALLSEEEDFADGRVTWEELMEQYIDFYRDEFTGATIPVPAGSRLTVEKSKDGNFTLVEVADPEFAVEMLLLVQSAATPGEADRVAVWFEEYTVSDGRKWELEKLPGEAGDYVDDELRYDPEDPYYFKVFDRVVYDPDALQDEYPDSIVVAELYASVVVEGRNVLGVAILVNDFDRLTPSQRLQYYVMESCAILADFAYY